LPNCQRQHDRKESRSKHVMLAVQNGKSCASQKRRGPQEILTLSRFRRRPPDRPTEFRRSVPKNPAGPAGLVQRSATRAFAFLVAP
jgi:hypothetical protein